ncbi:DivIVA domain-containing protein [Herbihabitans rhizosphaerae]|uniref:Cell wall synthesis protein Wag31 n=1 Tax=Herbihabitans rhizosphaerae TaxID=1872711 RepID=A0A4Q7KUX8_9PSEU|nr:DivIVA domain-containing protein [Herbihabitans rhizosphaerae]RZS40808.1 DivIVA domain-containing protein [Herbihabitans rhizosphaerae]
MPLNPKEVAGKRFSSPVIGNRAYREDEVRAFLRRVAATMRGRDKVTPVEITRVSFSRPKRNELGYSEDEVDAYLEDLAEELSRRSRT